MTEQEIILSNDVADIISDFRLPAGSIGPESREQYELTDATYIPVDQYLTINYVDRSILPPLSISTYKYRTIPQLMGLMQTVTGGRNTTFDPTPLLASGILQVQKEPLSLTGKGVVIGFVDTGIRYDQAVFQKEDGSTRILGIWDQTIDTGTSPREIPYGSEYTRDEINRALRSANPRDIVPSYDEDGHGTSVASVAAGSILNQGLTFASPAPEAEIVMVKCKEAKQYLRDFYLVGGDVHAYQENDIILAVKYIEQYAISFERPVVICIGMGTNMGNHEGDSLLAEYLSRISVKENRVVIVCGGNEGNSAHHYEGDAKQQEGGKPVDRVEIRVGDGVQGFWAELWGRTPYTHTVRIITPGGETTARVSSRESESRSFQFVYERTRITIDHILVEKGSGEELITFRVEAPTPGIWTIQVYTEQTYGGATRTFHIWLPIDAFLSGEVYFLLPSPYITLTDPCYSYEAIAPSTYNDDNNSFYAESGRGFSLKGRFDPDFAAPGVNVDTILGERTGSSISAAITAGAVAQFLQWAVLEYHDPWVDGNEVKNYFIRGAARNESLQYPNREWGYGRLNLQGVFDILAR